MPSSSMARPCFSLRPLCLLCLLCLLWQMTVRTYLATKCKRSHRRCQKRENVTVRSSGPPVRSPLETLDSSSRPCHGLFKQTCPVVELPCFKSQDPQARLESVQRLSVSVLDFFLTVSGSLGRW